MINYFSAVAASSFVVLEEIVRECEQAAAVDPVVEY
jgi:hypothetical protein